MSVSRVRKLEPISAGPCLHVGIDENGLGPVLGPLIVTGVAFVIDGPRPTSLGSMVGDSKALVSHEDPSLGEAWARALLIALGHEARTPAEVLSRICLDDETTLRAPCPSHETEEHHPSTMCWPRDAEEFIADDAMVRKCLDTIAGWTGAKVGGRFLRRTPVRLISVRTSIMCASRLNTAAAEGRHRFLVDLHEMERLALKLADDHGERVPLDAICGKVGGMDFYGDNFGPILHARGGLFAIEAEGGKLSAYRFPGFGRLAFMQDADARDPLVGLASLVGKWVRELTMGRIVRYLRTSALPEHLGPNEIPSASGYRDPNTKKLIAATELVRAHRGIPDRCFVR